MSSRPLWVSPTRVSDSSRASRGLIIGFRGEPEERHYDDDRVIIIITLMIVHFVAQLDQYRTVARSRRQSQIPLGCRKVKPHRVREWRNKRDEFSHSAAIC